MRRNDTRYRIVHRNLKWVVFEYSHHGEAVRGHYPTEAEARARVAQLTAQNSTGNLSIEENK